MKNLGDEFANQLALANLNLQAAENQSDLSRYIDKLLLEPDNEYIKLAIEYRTKAANAYKRALQVIDDAATKPESESLVQIPRIQR